MFDNARVTLEIKKDFMQGIAYKKLRKLQKILISPRRTGRLLKKHCVIK
jgi:hypothetical protein